MEINFNQNTMTASYHIEDVANLTQHYIDYIDSVDMSYAVKQIITDCEKGRITEEYREYLVDIVCRHKPSPKPLTEE